LNIAICEEGLGQLASAWQHYHDVLQELFVDDERLPFVKERISALEARVPRLTLQRGPRAPFDTRVRDGSVELSGASFGLPLPVDPGEHELEVHAPGHVSRHYRVIVAAGERVYLVVEPGPEQRSAAKISRRPALARSAGMRQAQPQPPRESQSVKRRAGFVLAASGAAAVAVGAISGIMVLDRKATVENGCDARKICTSEAIEAADSGTTLGAVSTIAFATGAVALISGAYLIISISRPPRPQTALGWSASAFSWGLSVHRTF
jgi:hypothetical protein